MWSLGITALEMAEGRPPLSDIHPMRAIFLIPNREPPQLQQPEKYSKQFREFLARCLVKDPAARPTSRELLMVRLGARARGQAARARGDGVWASGSGSSGWIGVW